LTTRVGGELLHALEAADVVDLVEDREREHLAHARDRAQELEGLGVVLLRLAHQVALEIREQGVVAFE
jgi:hypothetical protein